MSETTQPNRMMRLQDQLAEIEAALVDAFALALLVRLKSRRLYEYDALRKFARKADGGDVLFLPALNLLFLLGLVKYHPKTDSLEYLGPNLRIKEVVPK